MRQFPTARHAASWAGLCPGHARECRQTIVAVAHKILTTASLLLADGRVYQEPGAGYYGARHKTAVRSSRPGGAGPASGTRRGGGGDGVCVGELRLEIGFDTLGLPS
jgi:hypothetical protein